MADGNQGADQKSPENDEVKSMSFDEAAIELLEKEEQKRAESTGNSVSEKVRDPPVRISRSRLSGNMLKILICRSFHDASLLCVGRGGICQQTRPI
jgi:hypothetical protein